MTDFMQFLLLFFEDGGTGTHKIAGGISVWISLSWWQGLKEISLLKVYLN